MDREDSRSEVRGISGLELCERRWGAIGRLRMALGERAVPALATNPAPQANEPDLVGMLAAQVAEKVRETEEEALWIWSCGSRRCSRWDS